MLQKSQHSRQLLTLVETKRSFSSAQILICKNSIFASLLLQTNYFRQFVAVLLLIASCCSLTETLHIKCRYTMFKTFNTIGRNLTLLTNVYACKGTVWTICDNSVKCLGVSNNHHPGKHNYLVDFLEIMLYSFGPTLPKYIHNFYPNLLGLKVTFGSLERISSDDLQYPKLKVIHMGSNKLRSLDKDLFIHTPDLIFVGFENNQIASVDYKLFDSLTNLHTISMWGNVCVKRYFSNIKYMMKIINSRCRSNDIMKTEEPDNILLVDELKRHLVSSPSYRDCRKYFLFALDSRSSK